MTTEVNELDGSYLPGAHMPPSPSADDIEVTLPSDAITKDDGENAPLAGDTAASADITVSNPVTHDLDPKQVYVYANSINPVSSMDDSTIVSFDVVFSVSCTDPNNGTASTYQVVKRIGVDKMKMVNDAKMSTPISIVEAKTPTKAPMGLSTARFKALAGLK